MEQNAYKPPAADLIGPPNANPQTAEVRGPEGLGGWLILVGLGVVLSPFRIGTQFFQLYTPLFEDGTWENLTHPASPGFLPYYGLLVGVEIAVNLALFVAFCYLVYLFFSKNYRFPRVYAITMVFGFLFILADSLVVHWLYLPGEPMLDGQTLRELLPVSIAILIWVPYLHLSKRARSTFVTGRSGDSAFG